jgi:hypothetical protein
LQRLRTQHPFQAPQQTGTFQSPQPATTGAETVAVKPLEIEETVAVKPLVVDDSPTIMIPATTLGFPPDDDSR